MYNLVVTPVWSWKEASVPSAYSTAILDLSKIAFKTVVHSKYAAFSPPHSLIIGKFSGEESKLVI